MPYIKMSIEAGNDVYTYQYHTHRYGKHTPRGKNIKPTSEEQKKINKRIAQRKRQWTASANFKKDDWYITLTYRKSERPESNRAAAKVLSDILAKLHRKLKRLGIPLYYMTVTERGERGAIHHHLLIRNNFDIGMLINLWTYGRINAVSIYTDSMTELGAYFAKELSEETIYSASHNLKKPKIKKQVIKANSFSNTPKTKKGYTITHFYKGFQSGAGYLYQEYIQTKSNLPHTANENKRGTPKCHLKENYSAASIKT